MPWVRPVIGHVDRLDGATRERVAKCRRFGDHDVHRLGQCEAECGVDHVRGREPVVDPRAFGHADPRLHDVDEGGGVVIGDLLAFVHFGDERGVDDGTALAQLSPLRRAGSTPSSARPSAARSSTSSIVSNRCSSLKSAATSWGEYLGIIVSPLDHGEGDVAAHHPPLKGYERRALDRRDCARVRERSPTPVTARTRPPAVTKRPSSSRRGAGVKDRDAFDGLRRVGRPRRARR